MKHLPQSEAMRRNMVDSQLRPSGVNAPWILAAMLETPREAFLTGNTDSAYGDRPVPLGEDRWLNAPVATGQMLTLAEPAVTDRVLLVGGECGYLAALLAPRVASLVVVEESPALAASFAANLPDTMLVQGALAAGAAAHAPYDLILIDGAIETLPQMLVDQLADGGRIVSGLAEGPVTRLASGVKRGGQIVLRPHADLEIASLPGFALMKEFVF